MTIPYREHPDARERELTVFVQGLFRNLDRVEDYVWLHSRWYSMSDYQKIVAALAPSDSRASFCFLGRDVSRRHEEIAMLLDAGHEIGTHGPRHYAFTERDSAAFIRDQIGPCVEELGKLGAECVGYWSGYYDALPPHAVEVLEELGFKWFGSGIDHAHLETALRFVPVLDPHDYALRFQQRASVDDSIDAWRTAARDAARPASFLFHPFSLTVMDESLLPAWGNLMAEVGPTKSIRDLEHEDLGLLFDASLQIGWW